MAEHPRGAQHCRYRPAAVCGDVLKGRQMFDALLDTIVGLPVHPLVVHATEVVVPAAAIVVVVAALWPRFRR